MVFFGRMALPRSAGGDGIVIPVVDAERPERTGFYRVTDSGLERITAPTLREQFENYRLN